MGETDRRTSAGKSIDNIGRGVKNSDRDNIKDNSYKDSKYKSEEEFVRQLLDGIEYEANGDNPKQKSNTVTNSADNDSRQSYREDININTQNLQLQSADIDDMINNGGQNNELYNQETVARSYDGIKQKKDSFRERREIIRGRQENEVTFERGIKEKFRGNEQRLVIGDTTLVFKIAQANINSQGSLCEHEQIIFKI